MKKLISAVAAVFLCLLLCSCNTLVSHSENDRKFMVAALGFDSEDGLISLSAEIIIINSENAERDPEPQVFTEKGLTIESALSKICDSLSRPVLLEHCAVLAIGKTVDADLLKKIIDYCFNENRITISAVMVSCDNSVQLLSAETNASVAVGYEIMGITEQHSKNGDDKLNCRFFEVCAARKAPQNTFSLPYFTVNDKMLFYSGKRVYKNDTLNKTRTEAAEASANSGKARQTAANVTKGVSND